MAVLASPALPQPPGEKPVPEPSAALALEAVTAAIAACKAHGYPLVAATVVNAGGELKVMISADGTPPGHAVPRSAAKARAALAYDMPSADLQARAAQDAALTAELAKRSDIVPRAGGEPLRSHGVLIGAIGVSGAPGGDKDDACALAGLARIRDRL